MDKKTNIKAYSAAIFFSVLVGFSFLGIKTCVPLANSLEILVHRYNFAFLALLLILVFRVAKLNLRGKPKRNLFLTAAFYIGFMVLQVIGLCFSTSIEGSIIFAIVPIIAQIIASIFLGEKATLSQNILVCLSVVSLVVMIIMGSGSLHFHPVGITLLLLSSVSMAISNVFMRYVREQYTPIEISAAIIVMGCAAFNLAFLIYGLFSGTLHTYFEPFRYLRFIIATAYLGVGCILVSAQTMSYLLSKMAAVKATIFGNVSTAISIIAGVLVLGEPLLPYHIICAVLIIAGVVGLSVSGNKKEAEDEISISDGK